MKSGAASNPASYKKIAGDLLDINAGWTCESTTIRIDILSMVLANV